MATLQPYKNYVRGWEVIMAAFAQANNDICQEGLTFPSTVNKAVKLLRKQKKELAKSDLAESDKEALGEKLEAFINYAMTHFPTETEGKPCNVERGWCFIGPEACLPLNALEIMRIIDDKNEGRLPVSQEAAGAPALGARQATVAACGSEFPACTADPAPAPQGTGCCGSESAVPAPASHASVTSASNGSKKVLLLVPDGSEDMEVAAFIEIPHWTRVVQTQPIDVTVAGWEDVIKCYHGLKLVPDVNVNDVNVNDYDAIAIPGGWPGTKFNEQSCSPLILEMVRKMYNQGKVIATMCFGIFPLGEAGLLKGLKATSFTSSDTTCSTCQQVKAKILAYGTDFQESAIVIDHNVISDIGPAVADEVALRMTELLIGEEATRQIANFIMYNQVKRDELKWTGPNMD